MYCHRGGGCRHPSCLFAKKAAESAVLVHLHSHPLDMSPISLLKLNTLSCLPVYDWC